MHKHFPVGPDLNACADCRGPNSDYMVRSEVWVQAWQDSHSPEESTTATGLLLCLSCLERRAGRELLPEDFDLTLPINRGLRHLIRMGRKPGSVCVQNTAAVYSLDLPRPVKRDPVEDLADAHPVTGTRCSPGEALAHLCKAHLAYRDDEGGRGFYFALPRGGATFWLCRAKVPEAVAKKSFPRDMVAPPIMRNSAFIRTREVLIVEVEETHVRAHAAKTSRISAEVSP